VIRFRFSSRNLTYDNRVKLYKLPGKSEKKVSLGICVDDDTDLYFSTSAFIFFKEIRQWANLGWLLIISFFIFFLLLILKYKTLIKDQVSQLTGSDKPNTYFSFSKSQFAFWTFIIIASFIYIWAFTGDFNSINNTALILLGITSATITTSNLIETSQENRAASSGNFRNRLISFRIKGPDEKSHFFEDILSDADGISMHRLQSFVFNILFGIAFFKSVILNYTMPEFSEVLLILLGLSNGTYAFLKTTEIR
jgi:hypothetical protein